jgi:hypothetical protein
MSNYSQFSNLYHYGHADLRSCFCLQSYVNNHLDVDYILQNNPHEHDEDGYTHYIKHTDGVYTLAPGISLDSNYTTTKVKYFDQLVNLPRFKSSDQVATFFEKLEKKQIKVNNSEYRNLTGLFNRIVKTNGFAYPTTYGIGLEYINNFNFKEEQEQLTQMLNDLGVDYSCEYSAAKWVFRYKISKSQANLNKILLIDNL